MDRQKVDVNLLNSLRYVHGYSYMTLHRIELTTSLLTMISIHKNFQKKG